jgi:hypothetical protein
MVVKKWWFNQQNAGFNGINREFIWDLYGMFGLPSGKHTKSSGKWP